jgi:hypothetical protein
MKRKYVGLAALLFAVVLFVASCDLTAPDLVLRVVNPSIASIGGGNVRITFRLYNSGSDALQNCKVKWYVDDTNLDASDNEIEYDELTVWAPSGGVNLAQGQTSSIYTVDTTSGIFGNGLIGDGVNFYGVYEMGWDYSSQE